METAKIKKNQKSTMRFFSKIKGRMWPPVPPPVPSAQKIVYNSCDVNCGSRCMLKLHVRDGQIIRVESDNTGDDEYGCHQIRACLRGYSIAERMNHKDRITTPLKRSGNRGEGKFEPISWAEAFSIIAGKMKDIKARFGNQSFYINYGTGSIGNLLSRSFPVQQTCMARLLNCFGGYLESYNTYSSAQITTALNYMYGPGIGGPRGNPISQVAHCKLAVFFGYNPAETFMSGGGRTYDLIQAKERGDAKIIVIDPRYTDTAVQAADQWLAIRPGTDGALASAIAWVLIKEDLVDHGFIDKYTIGYDEKNLPKNAPANSSYKHYILGKGPDKTTKTPAWAEEICGIPQDQIISLAREIGTSKPAYIIQGWGPQRHLEGEQSVRAICMLPVLTGNVGILGGNCGDLDNGRYMPVSPFPVPENPVKASIPVYLWSEAVKSGLELTAKKNGLKNCDRLESPLKFIWNYAGNTLINQHSDINATKKLLSDESLCEMIVVVDHFMTSSARFADILLPATSNLEEIDIAASQGASSEMAYLIFKQKAVEPPGLCLSIYDICAGIAKELGIEKEYTQGKTRTQWLETLYQQIQEKVPELPGTFEQALDMGFYKKSMVNSPQIPFKDFTENKASLDTPSGKIEIYSETLSQMAKTWELPKGQEICALPRFREWEMLPPDPNHPLLMITHHYKQRTHSTYGNIDRLKEVAPQCLWINLLDAKERGIKHQDLVMVKNLKGKTLVPAKVTPRIMPGVVSLPQGAWHKIGSDEIDRAGNANVLTYYIPTALAKANPQHSNRVEVELYERR